MSEDQVLTILGPPFKTYERDSAPEDYYVEGYAKKVRPITGKVFIYIGSEPILYVYFDESHRVEETFIGGS